MKINFIENSINDKVGSYRIWVRDLSETLKGLGHEIKILQNIFQYYPPIDKIRKLKFTFRYHDGRLVNFKNSNFNFTIAFNELRNEIARDYTILNPA